MNDRFEEIIKKASVMKKHMLARNLIKAKAKCPYCEGYWHGILAGPKNHLHFSCDGSCKTMMMS